MVPELNKNITKKYSVNFNNIPTKNRKNTIYFLLILFLQFNLSLGQMVHNGLLLLSFSSEMFRYSESRITLQVSLILNLLWSITVILAFIGEVKEYLIILIPHFCLSVDNFIALLLPSFLDFYAQNNSNIGYYNYVNIITGRFNIRVEEISEFVIFKNQNL
ncbi:unnamed protein product [Meloidogyne enterolobii]|uniref:Uncharacterized protein n=1 Tax=Meloidogyne enterolobii TaxID=390850 RepID=A0ACB1AYN5_MELEN